MNRVKELEVLIKKHKTLYYAGKPEISDHEYDKLEDELKKLDPSNYSLILVGSDETSLDRVKHDKKMLSLGKTYDTEELLKWIGNHKVISMFKIDGVSCSLIYENGELIQSKTRGNGIYGENITSKVQWIEGIPKAISIKERIEIRGELYCDESHFFHLSDEMGYRELERPTSQRNIVAGLISRKENIDLCRYIQFKSFDILYNEYSPKEEIEKFKTLKKIGFDITECSIIKDKNDLETVINEARSFISEGDYQIDGLVFTYNDIKLHEELGETAHHPRYKLAFKFPGESKTTSLKDIEWSVSRNGVLTPVGIVKPIELSGAKISRVTLHNYGLVRQYNLKIGDEIEIIRSGEVIPKFLSVVSPSKGKFAIPTNCPICESLLEIEDIRLLCLNKNCPGKNKESILYFIQKIGIETISKSRIDEMIKSGLVQKVQDLYRLSEDDFLVLDKVKEKLSKKFVAEIEKSKNTTLPIFLSALGIQGGGINSCEKIVHHGFNTIDKILNLTVDQLEEIEGFAKKSSTDFINSLSDKKPLIKDLMKIGFKFEFEEIVESAISGKKICITGTLSSKRSVVQDKIKKGGGIVVSSVSNNTDYLVTNDTDSNSSKFKKAKEFKIPIITEEKLNTLLGIH